MADSKELKPKSFRIEDETADKFKEISSKFSNQQEAFAKLIEAYEFQLGKSVLTEKKVEIEQFEKYVNVLTRMFMGSLEDNQNITETVRTEFDALLKSKDMTIQDLQEKLTVAKQLKEDATLKAKTFADENVRLNNTIENMIKDYSGKLSDMQKALNDKTDLTDTLKDSCIELKRKVEAMQHDQEQFKVVSAELKTVSAELDSSKHKQEQTERDKADLQKQLERERREFEKDKANLQNQMDRDNKEFNKVVSDLKQHELDALARLKEQSQLDMDKSILALEKMHQEQIEKLKGQIELIKEQKQAEVDKYQQRYLELLEQIKTKNMSFLD